MEKLKVAILGSGNIGADLLMKVMRSHYLECSVFIGRNLSSSGMTKALALGIPVSTEGIEYIVQNPDCCEIAFDATSAQAHMEHALILEKLGIIAIDLTPAKIGMMSVFAVNGEDCLKARNINMVTCGGQTSIPIAYAIAKVHGEIEYLEVVSNIASNSAGPATRINLDEYIHTTEQGLQYFSGAKRTKAILNLNPAVPCINMQTTIFAKVKEPRLDLLSLELDKMLVKIRQYVPGYELLLGPILENGRIVIMIRVTGLGDYLPKYAGNLDIINCAAIAMAELLAQHKLQKTLIYAE